MHQILNSFLLCHDTTSIHMFTSLKDQNSFQMTIIKVSNLEWLNKMHFCIEYYATTRAISLKATNV